MIGVVVDHMPLHYMPQFLLREQGVVVECTSQVKATCTRIGVSILSISFKSMRAGSGGNDIITMSKRCAKLGHSVVL